MSPLFVLANFRMDLREDIWRIAESKLANPGYFVVDVIVALRGKQKVLVIIDGDAGVTIDDCATLSRSMSDDLDKLPGLGERYMLEVSTPGVDHPLRFNRQYAKHIGRKLKISLRDKTQIEGRLINVSPETLVVEEEIGTGKKKEIKTIALSFSDIEKSIVLVSFK